ncbi:MAG: hypothetical protein AAFO80_02105 [Pseudomonadota bacterium]
MADFEGKIERAQRMDWLLREQDVKLGDVERGLPKFWRGYTLPGALGLAVFCAIAFIGAFFIELGWPNARVAVGVLAPMPFAVFGYSTAARLAEEHIYWIIGETRRGR